jgi:hypothetical protein
MNATQTFACEFASRYESFFYDDYATATDHFEAAIDAICATAPGAVQWFVTEEENRDIRRGYEVTGADSRRGGRTVSLTASLNGKFAVGLGNLDAKVAR